MTTTQSINGLCRCSEVFATRRPHGRTCKQTIDKTQLGYVYDVQITFRHTFM